MDNHDRRPMKAGSAMTMALIALSITSATAACAAPKLSPAYLEGWTTAHADSANTDYSPVTGAADLTLAWKRDLGGMINLGATSDGAGRLYLTTAARQGCRLYALDRVTGETIWCSDKLDRMAVSSSPLLDRDGRIFLADSTAMRAFDRDGKVLWETPIVGAPLSAQFTPAGDLFFITHIGRIYLLRRDTGAAAMPMIELIPGATFDPAQGARACMRGTADCPSANTPAIDPRTGVVYFTFWAPGAKNAGIRAMRLTPGPRPSLEPLWVNETLPGGSGSSPDISADGRRLYLTDNAGGLHALDAATGKAIWSFPIGFESGGSPSTSPDGLIMPAGGGKGALMAIRDKGPSAELVWRRDELVNRGIAPQTGNGLAYAAVLAAEGENDLVVVDTATGAVLDRERLPGKTMFTVGTTIDLDGTIYVPTIRGQLFAFRPAARP